MPLRATVLQDCEVDRIFALVTADNLYEEQILGYQLRKINPVRKARKPNKVYILSCVVPINLNVTHCSVNNSFVWDIIIIFY